MKNAGKRQTVISNNGSLHGFPKKQPASDLPLDMDKYKGHMADTDLTEEQQAEFLQTLWSIMKAFVDLGFDVNSIQSFMPELAANSSETSADRVELENKKPTQEFEKSARDPAAKGGNL